MPQSREYPDAIRQFNQTCETIHHERVSVGAEIVDRNTVLLWLQTYPLFTNEGYGAVVAIKRDEAVRLWESLGDLLGAMPL